MLFRSVSLSQLMQSLAREVDKIEDTRSYCPHCGVPLKYTKVERADGRSTHLWTCSECPNIVLEYVDLQDAIALVSYVTGGVVSWLKVEQNESKGQLEEVPKKRRRFSLFK